MRRHTRTQTQTNASGAVHRGSHGYVGGSREVCKLCMGPVLIDCLAHNVFVSMLKRSQMITIHTMPIRDTTLAKGLDQTITSGLDIVNSP